MDDRDLTQQLEDTYRNWTGGKWTPQVTVNQFMIRGPGRRAQVLDQFDAEFRKLEPGDSENSLRKISELTDLRAELDVVHNRLLRSGR
jgi:hypothetical protein